MKKQLPKMILSALFLVLALVLPFITGQIATFGNMLCPMHLPILLCGFICGWKWGLVIGFSAPLLRALTLGAPVLFPTAVCMALELAAYGFLTGFLHRLLPDKKMFIYPALLISMLLGRLVWGAAMFTFTGGFTFGAFVAGAFTGALPGIILQIVVVPPLVMLAKRLLLKRSTDL